MTSSSAINNACTWDFHLVYFARLIFCRCRFRLLDKIPEQKVILSLPVAHTSKSINCGIYRISTWKSCTFELLLFFPRLHYFLHHFYSRSNYSSFFFFFISLPKRFSQHVDSQTILLRLSFSISLRFVCSHWKLNFSSSDSCSILKWWRKELVFSFFGSRPVCVRFRKCCFE